GIATTTLAAEPLRRTLHRAPGRIVVTLTGPLSIDGILTELITTVRRPLLLAEHPDQTALRALAVAADPSNAWRDRLALLHEYVLPTVRVLLVLDNFEDNLTGPGTPHHQSDAVSTATPGTAPPGTAIPGTATLDT